MLACCTCYGVGDSGLEEEEFDTTNGEGAQQRFRETNSEQGTLRSRATFSSGRKSPSSAQSSPMSLQRRSRPPPLLIPDSSPSAHMMGSPSPGAAGPGMGREDLHLGVMLRGDTHMTSAKFSDFWTPSPLVVVVVVYNDSNFPVI